jgi:hypothetical protein
MKERKRALAQEEMMVRVNAVERGAVAKIWWWEKLTKTPGLQLIRSGPSSREL